MITSLFLPSAQNNGIHVDPWVPIFQQKPIESPAECLAPYWADKEDKVISQKACETTLYEQHRLY